MMLLWYQDEVTVGRRQEAWKRHHNRHKGHCQWQNQELGQFESVGKWTFKTFHAGTFQHFRLKADLKKQIFLYEHIIKFRKRQQSVLISVWIYIELIYVLLKVPRDGFCCGLALYKFIAAEIQCISMFIQWVGSGCKNELDHSLPSLFEAALCVCDKGSWQKGRIWHLGENRLSF